MYLKQNMYWLSHCIQAWHYLREAEHPMILKITKVWPYIWYTQPDPHQVSSAVSSLLHQLTGSLELRSGISYCQSDTYILVQVPKLEREPDPPHELPPVLTRRPLPFPDYLLAHLEFHIECTACLQTVINLGHYRHLHPGLLLSHLTAQEFYMKKPS